jgi:uncharacterized OB-fold protein
MTELQIQHCERCGTDVFPDRLWCPGCGAGTLQHVPAGPGRVEEETTLRRPPTAEPVRLGTVRLDSGPLIIARLAGGTGAGTQVRLDRTTERTIWARATPD